MTIYIRNTIWYQKKYNLPVLMVEQLKSTNKQKTINFYYFNRNKWVISNFDGYLACMVHVYGIIDGDRFEYRWKIYKNCENSMGSIVLCACLPHDVFINVTNESQKYSSSISKYAVFLHMHTYSYTCSDHFGISAVWHIPHSVIFTSFMRFLFSHLTPSHLSYSTFFFHSLSLYSKPFQDIVMAYIYKIYIYILHVKHVL